MLRPPGPVVSLPRSVHRRGSTEKGSGRHQIQSERPSHRVAAAAALSSLLALSAGLYPLFNNSHPLGLYPPKYGAAGPPSSADFDVINVPEVILLDLKHTLPALLESYEQSFPDWTDAPLASKSLRSLRALASVTRMSPGFLGAAGGGGGGLVDRHASRDVPAEVLLTVGNVLEVLMNGSPDLPLADIGTLQVAALNRLVTFLQLQFPGLSVHEIARIPEAMPVHAVEVASPEINNVELPTAHPAQSITLPVQPAVALSPPVAPSAPEIVAEPSATPRDVTLLKPHLTTRAGELADKALAGTSPSQLGKTVSTVTSRVGQGAGGASGTLGSATGSLGSVSKSLGSVSRSLGGSSSESDAGSSGGG